MLDVPAKAKRSHLWTRAADEFYVEPVRATEQLLAVEDFAGDVWDPACGQGNVIAALAADGVRAFGTDIRKRVDAPWFLGEFDFLSEARPPLAFENIVFNPPFGRAKLAEAFIRKALGITLAKVAAFVDVRFLAGKDRAAGLYAEHPPSRVWIITPRPSCPPGGYLAAGNVAQGGQADYCWLVWDDTISACGPTLGWLT